ncbi:hypothetical protein N3K66_006955 [Trichothecium roseum]|uniref:Uncharacterized protein n=1 Tax=Trichothecium roseum TaxID=47278 RepID=A0ACC0UWR4_9HYPO|nr:hypothetical protein N3K66_006955 [Trichothecium roseum]
MASPSPFLEPPSKTSPDSLAIVLLSRDAYQPITLEKSAGEVDGYAEGAVLNTRFGSFPHSTLLNVPWGSQVRASTVDTGSRGRKRRRETLGDGDDTSTPASTPAHDEKAQGKGPLKKATTASSGFIHIMRPSPELWTMSLPHRTQVVYTPDYSYILSRIRARPGTRLIEAGSGSGSFTHASARAVYNGIPTEARPKRGAVFSFEFNEDRFHKMQEEVKGHYLEDMVTVTHRNVYKNGFLVNGQSPKATAVFLDVPAPWEALPHLSRRRPEPKAGQESSDTWVSPLDPKKTVYICTFSPCIEQVMQTVTELRKLGWIDVDMVEVANKRFNVLRDRVGATALPKDRNYNPNPSDVTEAVRKLKENNVKTQVFHGKDARELEERPASRMDVDESGTDADGARKTSGAATPADQPTRALGRLIHRPELEIKSHTSYLVFAMLPREWTEEDEAAALAKWPCGNEAKTVGHLDKEARKEAKRELLQGKKKQKRENTTA